MKEWMAQANPPKESSTFERMNDQLQLLLPKKITQYFKVLLNTLNNSNHVSVPCSKRQDRNHQIQFCYSVRLKRSLWLTDVFMENL